MKLWDLFSGKRRAKEEKQEEASAEPAGQTRRPALYFGGDGLDERSMIYDRLPCPYGIIDGDGQLMIVRHHSEYPVVQTVKADGRRFVARMIGRHLLFRDPHSPLAEDALYLGDTSFEDFAETYEDGMPGRCMMHIPRCMDEGHCLYLFFDGGGEGYALHLAVRYDIEEVECAIEHEWVEFWWEYFSETEDILTQSVEQLRKLCQTVFERHINRSLRTPYKLHPELIDDPLLWQSGSEQELRQLAHAICCTEPGLFDAQEPVKAVYRAATDDKRGGFLYVERDYERFTSRRLMALGDLAFRLNPCSGMKWNVLPGTVGYLNKAAERITVTVEPPTAHEKAEAFLILVDWLDDKLHDPEKRARFGLPPRSTMAEI